MTGDYNKREIQSFRIQLQLILVRFTVIDRYLMLGPYETIYEIYMIKESKYKKDSFYRNKKTNLF